LTAPRFKHLQRHEENAATEGGQMVDESNRIEGFIHRFLILWIFQGAGASGRNSNYRQNFAAPAYGPSRSAPQPAPQKPLPHQCTAAGLYFATAGSLSTAPARTLVGSTLNVGGADIRARRFKKLPFSSFRTDRSCRNAWKSRHIPGRPFPKSPFRLFRLFRLLLLRVFADRLEMTLRS
jgi:hypothetical protein